MDRAQCVIDRCRFLAQFTEEPGHITRIHHSQAMHDVHAHVGQWMREAGMTVTVDAAANIRGRHDGLTPDAPTLYIGSHLDTVPHAGAFDGILGVVLAISLIGRRYRFAIEVVGFADEEGARTGKPFLGSLAFIEQVPAGALGYLEFHIEQGPVLDQRGIPLAVVDTIVGQTRLELVFHGKASHAGTTPMQFRQDALCAAAEWVLAVQRHGGTVGRLEVFPGAPNVIPGEVRATLDLRHADDAVRLATVDQLIAGSVVSRYDQPAVAMDPKLSSLLQPDAPRMPSGAGHDAMIMARRMPAAMLFLRSPGGISHHPDETVLVEDVDAALRAGEAFLDRLEASLA